jgi:hypothetical protein
VKQTASAETKSFARCKVKVAMFLVQLDGSIRAPDQKKTRVLVDCPLVNIAVPHEASR